MDESSDNDKEENKDLSKIYKIFREIYSKVPTFLMDLSNDSIDANYKESILDSIDFKTINNKIEAGKYTAMADVLKDIRLVFLNCYKFYGAKSKNTMKSLKLEKLFESKISSLDENFKSLASIQHTFSLLKMEGKQSLKFRYPKNCYDSVLLRSVAHLRPERLKQYHNIYSNTLTTDEDNVHILEELVSWEIEVYFKDNYQLISSMWELPEIGNFVAIIFKQFGFGLVNQSEIERMFLMPKESATMSKIMTTLLMPVRKSKYIGEEMPYKIWSEKLCNKVSKWYKVYHYKKQNKVSAMQSLGIHPDFWAIVGDKNPLAEYDYCELSYFKKVWIVKGLCDYVSNEYKTINDIITNSCERQCTIWKNDLETEVYFSIDSMPDLRIYYYNIPYDEPSVTFLDPDKTAEKIVEEDVLSTSHNADIFHSKSQIKPNEKCFKLIANSVQGLRSFLDELDNEDASVPENLIQALEDFITKIEPQEYNFIVLENNSKIKLFKDWKSYPDRLLKEEEKILFWKESESKPISHDNNEKIIWEKRKRKPVKLQEFNTDVELDSDDRVSEKEDGSLSDFTDSEDEWGAMNQPKNKTKQASHQPPSKLVELEKRLKKEDKLPKRSKKHFIKGDIKDIFCETENKNVSISNEQKEKETENKSVICENKENNVKQNVVSNTFVINNGYNNNSVISLKIDFSNVEVSSYKKNLSNGGNKEGVSLDSEKEIMLINDDKTSLMCKKQNLDIDNECKIMLPHSKKIKIDVLKNEHIVTIDDDESNDCKILKKDNSKTIISNNDVKEIPVSNEQGASTKNESSKSNLIKVDEIISIDDDDDNDQIVISDDEDDVQLVSISTRPRELSVKNNKPHSLNKNWNKPYNSLLRNSSGRQIVSTTSVPKLSPNISILPANVHVPKGIEVTMVKQPQNTITSHLKSFKRPATNSNGHLKNNGLMNNNSVNVECKVISKPNLNGEVKFYISLPNGKLHPVSDELMNQYLKDHNNRLPDYWIVPLSVEVAKQYGFN